jgi:hypothetical protein
MEVSRSHTSAIWLSKSTKYMSPEISTTIPIPLGICTRSLSLGLQIPKDLSRDCGNALIFLAGLRNELNPPKGVFAIILLLSGFLPLICSNRSASEPFTQKKAGAFWLRLHSQSGHFLELSQLSNGWPLVALFSAQSSLALTIKT